MIKINKITIDKNHFLQSSYTESIHDHIKDKGIEKQDIISITEEGNFVTLWYYL